MFGCNSIMARKERKEGALSKQKQFQIPKLQYQQLGNVPDSHIFH